MVTEKELQEKILTYRILQSRLDDTIRQRDLIMNKEIEIENTLASIDEIKSNEEETIFPLGSETYIFGKKVNKKKILVGIGANIILEQELEEGKKILNKRKIELEKTLDKIQKEINQLSYSIEKLTPEIQAMIEKSQKAG